MNPISKKLTRKKQTHNNLVCTVSVPGVKMMQKKFTHNKEKGFCGFSLPWIKMVVYMDTDGRAGSEGGSKVVQIRRLHISVCKC